MGAGKYSIKIYDTQTRKTLMYLGPYKTKKKAREMAEVHEASYKRIGKKHIGISILD